MKFSKINKLDKEKEKKDTECGQQPQIPSLLTPETQLPKYLTQSFVPCVLESHRTLTRTPEDRAVCNHRCQCTERN